jgi:hypothetical protein
MEDVFLSLAGKDVIGLAVLPSEMDQGHLG